MTAMRMSNGRRNETREEQRSKKTPIYVYGSGAFCAQHLVFFDNTSPSIVLGVEHAQQRNSPNPLN